MKYSYYSDKGNHKKRNEDAFELHIATCANRMRGMIAVCDGVSTSDDGLYASRFVISKLHELFERWKEYSLDWRHEVNKIHEELYEQLRSGRVDLILNDQRRAFSDEYVNLILSTAECQIEIAERPAD